MEQVNLSVYERESERLASKLQQLLINVEEFRLDSEPAEQVTTRSFCCNTDNLVSEEIEDDVLDADEDWLGHKNSWLYDKNDAKEKTGNLGPLESDGNDVDVSNVIRSLKESSICQWPFKISTKTFARPKKGRSSLGNIGLGTPPADVGSPKLRRRLTTTIDPSPALIPHLEQLSRTNNRPLSNCDDLNWEDGATEALAEQVSATPKRPTVPASLLQRLQELKETNNVRRPFCPMTVSQFMTDIPDLENTEPESFLSLGDVSILSAGDSNRPLMDSMDPRLTFGGVVLPPGRHLTDLNNTFAMPDPLIEVSEHNSTFTKDEDPETKLYITNPVYNDGVNGDENRNVDLKNDFKGYSSKLFDKTFPKSGTVDGVELMLNTETEYNETFSREEIIKVDTVKSEENVQSYQYSTATYSRPSARFSPARSGLPMRRASPASHVSTEDLARSPARSDGTITPVESRPAHGTYTRNSPVERNGSEDEQMSTTSDHSGRSHDSIEDLPNRCKTNGTGKRQISTPRASTEGLGLEDWHMSPINRSQMTPARSIERLGAARVLNKLPHGPMPLKPALIRPTENFKRPVAKKNEISSIAAKMPMKPVALPPSGLSGLPKPAGRGLPTRIPAGRLSCIPRPPPTRLGTTMNKSNT